MFCFIYEYRFSKCRFVDINGIFESGTPMYPHEFEEVVKKQCAKAKDDLIKMWVKLAVVYLIEKE